MNFLTKKTRRIFIFAIFTLFYCIAATNAASGDVVFLQALPPTDGTNHTINTQIAKNTTSPRKQELEKELSELVVLLRGSRYGILTIWGETEAQGKLHWAEHNITYSDVELLCDMYQAELHKFNKLSENTNSTNKRAEKRAIEYKLQAFWVIFSTHREETISACQPILDDKNVDFNDKKSSNSF